MTIGLPTYEKRNQPVSPADLKILQQTNKLLADASHWSKENSNVCDESPVRTLACALRQACIRVTGVYTHRQPALQEVRFAVNDKFKKRWKIHRLQDFNAHPATTFADVKDVLSMAIASVRRKLNETNQQ